MKCSVMLFTIILVLLAACQSNESEKNYEAKTQNIPSEQNGLRQTMEKDQYSNQEKITVIIQNTTNNEFTYGTYFTIEQNIKGIWYTVPFKDGIGFEDIGLILKPNETNKETYSLELLNKDLSAGKYRLVKSFIYSEQAYSVDNKITLASPFEIITP